jgi:hypothetical protein
MGLRKKGQWWQSDSQADIPQELIRFGRLNEYEPSEFADCKCPCGSRTFRLTVDDEEGAAVRTCTACQIAHPIADSADYLTNADLQPMSCVCTKDIFEITVGLSLYEVSDDVAWLYIGCRCPSCGVTGCYGDWMNEYEGFDELLEKV